jgi:hypothetical protein
MSAMQKFAWFNLAVIALTVVVMLSLLPVLGYRTLGSFGFLGLLGFGPLFFLKKRGQVLTDERDWLIQMRSTMLAYGLFWVVFVFAAAFLASAVYGPEGAVPVKVVQFSVMGGFMFMYAVASIAILIQYGRGAKDGE